MLVGGVLVIGLAVLSAVAEPHGVPPGQPFQALQKQINALAARVAALTAADSALDARIAALEAAAREPALVWINHVALLSGDTTVVTTSFNSTSSGVGGGLAGLVIHSTTTGDRDSFGGNKVVWRALEVPPHFLIKSVRVCYELSSAGSFISQIRLARVQDPPKSALVLLDDATHLTNPGPVCVDSASTSVDPSLGAVLLDLRVNFGNTADTIVIRGLGLHLQPAP